MRRTHGWYIGIAGLLLVLANRNASAQTDWVRHPDSARIVTSDVENFARALQLLAGGETDTVDVLWSEYFLPASPGLRAYVRGHGFTAAALAEDLGRRPVYYRAIAAAHTALLRREPEIRAAYRKLSAIYPPAVFPPVYFFVGGMYGRRSDAPAGLLVPVELLGRSLDAPVAAASGSAALLTESTVEVIAHELAHAQLLLAQGPAHYASVFDENLSLLALAVREGSAELITSLITGRFAIIGATRDYGMRHERRLWSEFKQSMHARDPGDWMLRRPVEHDGWPRDLGYFIGFRIAESYLMRAPDKRSAIHNILGVLNYHALLRDSGYDP